MIKVENGGVTEKSAILDEDVYLKDYKREGNQADE